jgi:hypothetical protein
MKMTPNAQEGTGTQKGAKPTKEGNENYQSNSPSFLHQGKTTR